jgi:hypothetical protein
VIIYQSFIIINIKDKENIVQDFKQDIQSELRKLSEDVNNQTYKQNKMTKSGQLFDILRNTPDNIAKL